MWTHIYDLILKFLSLILILCLVLAVPGLIDHPFIAFLFLSILWSLCLIFVVRTPGSWLYCRFRLKMPVSFSQAAKLNHVLSPNPFSFKLHGQKWLPLLEVLEVEMEERFDLAMKIADTWETNRAQKARQTKEDLRNAPGKSRFILFISGVVVIYCLVAAFAELPPANYYIRLYCRLLDTDRYPVVLIACMMILTIFGPIALIKKIKDRS